MASFNKTVYFVLGDLNAPAPPPMPTSDEAKRFAKEAFLGELKSFGDDSIKTLTEESISALTDVALDAYIETIKQNLANDPELARQQGLSIDYTRIAQKWKNIAIARGSADAQAVASYADFVMNEHAESLQLLQNAAENPEDAIRGVKRIGNGIGHFFTAMDIAGAAQSGAGNPRDFPTELAGLFVGGAVTTYLMNAAGGLAAILGAPVAVAAGALTLILAAGYMATQLGELVWDALLNDAFWDYMEDLGYKESLEKWISKVGYALDPYLPGDPDTPYLAPKFVESGSVIAANENENIVMGNDGSNEISMLHGRTTAFGKGGDDTYVLYDTATGNQIIEDTEGDNTLKFGVVNVAQVDYERVGTSDIYRSPEDYFTLDYNPAADGGKSSLVVSSKHFPGKVTLLGWENGDFGIFLPGMPTEPEPPVPGTGGTAGADYLNPTVMGTPNGSAVNLDGGDGKDMIWGGFANTDDTLRGGDGDDIINGRGGKDVIEGGWGNDHISGFGDDSTVDGGAGDDVIDAGMYYGWNYLATAQIPITEADIWRDLNVYFTWTPIGELLLNTETFDLHAGVSFAGADGFDYTGQSTVPGWTYSFSSNNGAYRLIYRSASEPDGETTGAGLITYGGNTAEFTSGVTLSGGSGNDSITGSSADDHIDGGADNDVIVGGAGNDSINGGTGDDQISGGVGDDVLNGGEGVDLIFGESGRDVISGGAGDDQLWGDRYEQEDSGIGDDDYIDGGSGNDQIAGQGGNDILDGGSGDDIIFGGTGDDILQGRDGADYLQGDTGNDIIFGHEGDDLLHGNDGDDSLSGGDGKDELQGGDGNDYLDGGADNDKLYGEAGDDVLYGGDGDDELYAGTGDDRLSGGTGMDTLGGGEGNDVLDGGEGNDILDGEAGNDTIYGGAGDDTIDGDDGDDVVYAGIGNDSIYGGTGQDIIHGEDGNDIVTAAEGDDQVYGGAGDDTLQGNAGNDSLYGEDGDDQLVGGEGNDLLVGGAGLNRYYFDRQFGQDIVQLAVGSQDQIYLRQEIAAEEVTFTRDQDDLVLAMGDGSSLRLVGYFAADTAAWIQLGDGSWISRATIDSGLYYGAIGGGSGNGDTLQGIEDDDRLYGLGGDDTIDGLGGNDLIDGGEGNDTLTDGQGDDYVLGGTGNDVINLVYNGGGNGTDRVDGGAGDDTYNIHWGSGHDVIGNLGAANAGSDVINLIGISQNMVMNYQISGSDLTIFVSSNIGSPNATADNIIVLEGFLTNSSHRVRFTEGTEITAADFQQRSWTGTSGDDTYVGTFAPDVISGLAGNDTLSGMDGNDILYGGTGDDVLDGGAGNDTLYGDEGNDIVRGGEGDDRLYMAYRGGYTDRYIGGAGNDAYYLNHNYVSSVLKPTTDGSQIEEEAGGGIDTLYTNFYNVTLAANVENLVHTPANFWWSDSPSRLVGNALDNVIQIVRTATATHMKDLSFRLDGNGGQDTLMGSSSKDTYVIDSYDDVIVEQQTDYDSIDTVETSIDYSIETRLELENIRLTGSAVSATGNSDDNVLEGHLVAGVNQLSGLGGNDTYLITRQDVVIEAAGGGNDTVVIAGWDETSSATMWLSVSDYANVENITLQLNYGAPGLGFRGNLQGDGGANVLKGNMFRNEIRGGAGDDVIWGHYENPLDSDISSISNRDQLYGEAGDDTLMSSIYGADLHGGAGNDLLIGVGGAYIGGKYTKAYGGNDRFFYEAGGGTDRIRFWNRSFDDFDQVIFGEGIDPDDVVWSQDGTSLVVQVGSNPDDRLIVEDYWREVSGQYTLVRSIDEFVFADGTIRRGDLNQLPYNNNPPVATWFQLPATTPAGEAFMFVLPDGAFTDDADDYLVYSVTGPDWISIDPTTGTLSGTPPLDAEHVSVTITAKDRFGESASVSASFEVIAVVAGTEGDDVLTGTARSEELRGLAGNDRLAGGGGTNVLVGGLGDDTYVLDDAGYDRVVELAGEGFDTVESSRYEYRASENIERIVLVEGSVAYSAYGTNGAQELVGNADGNYLDGGAGADQMVGGAGDDYYVVDDAGDIVVEASGEGQDSVFASVSWTLSANVESASLADGENLSLIGNDLANTLYGNDWDNVLDGGLGADLLYGYSGDDTYFLDSDADRVFEREGEGIDTVVRGFGSQYILADNVENLRLTGNAGQGNGNALDNLIEGSAAANTLLGLDGDDQLRGMAGNDTLWGGNGDDLLVGGEGDDVYVIDATSGSDQVDNTGGGSDTLLVDGLAMARLGFARDGDDLLVIIDGAATPAARIIDHFLGDDAAIDYVQASDNRYSAAQIAAIINGDSNPGTSFDQTLTGSAADEQLVGSSGRDLIKGLAGNDQLFGMGGNDTLQGGDGDDYLSGGNGSGSGSGDDRLEGGAGTDTLVGEDGVNTLIGGAGNDNYVYGGGQDTIDNTGGGTDGVFFNNGITASDLTFYRDGDDLVITVAGNASGFVRVTDHFLGGDMALDFVQPASGNMLNTAAINALAQTGYPGGGEPGGGDPDPGTSNPGSGGNEGNDSDYPNVVTGTANSEQLLGSSGRDLIRGLGGDDTVFGFAGDDKLDGGDGDDYLSGGNGSFSGSGNDILIGGAGNDTLVGEDGNDMLIGGAGDDFYYYAEGSDFDTVDNVGGGTDWLYFADIDSSRLSYHQDGDDLVVLVDGDLSQGFLVLDHFLGGEAAIAYVQPASGYALSATQIASQLSPLPGNLTGQGGDSFAQAMSMSMKQLGTTEPLVLTLLADTESDAAQVKVTPLPRRLTQAEMTKSVVGAHEVPCPTQRVHERLLSGHAGSDYSDTWSSIDRWERRIGSNNTPADRFTVIEGRLNPIQRGGRGGLAEMTQGQGASPELDQLIAAMAGFRSHEVETTSLVASVRHQSMQLAVSAF